MIGYNLRNMNHELNLILEIISGLACDPEKIRLNGEILRKNLTDISDETASDELKEAMEATLRQWETAAEWAENLPDPDNFMNN
jgi:hypothetical protein